MKPAALAGAAVLALAAASGAAADGAKAASVAASIDAGFAVAAQRVLDVDGDGRSDLLVVGEKGEVRVGRTDPKSASFSVSLGGALVLRHPDRTLLAVADLVGGGAQPQLVEMTRDGVFIHRVDADGSFMRAGEPVAPKARLPFRVTRPTFAEIARDVNGDGRPDLVVPRGEECDLWLNGGADASTGLPVFTKAASIRVTLQRESAFRAEALSDVLESSFRIPNLTISDVNGDARADLHVENGKSRAWHLQRDDGSFPADADVTLDLEIFRDTTAEATVQLGKTLAGGDDQRIETRDLDADGIPDYVIAHRRKVWVFRGSPAGPQFTEPSDILRVADDVTALLLLKLDDDEFPDLMLLRVQVPTVATLLRGLVAEWSLDVAALGYASLGGKHFDTAPKWKGTLEVRLPAILGVLKNPEALIKKFEDVSKKFRKSVAGDFDGDGRADVALVTEEGARLELFTSNAGAAGAESERAVGDVFFGEETKTWDLDQILRWMGDVAQRQAARQTGGAPPFAAWTLREAPQWRRTGVDAGDFDGDGRSEIVVSYESAGTAMFDVVRVE